MAIKPPPRVVESLAAPQHYVPPSVREIRAQAVQRLQTGLFGLAGIVLLVGLANIINDRARMADAAQTSGQVEQTKDDPLADIGVVPSTAESAAPPASSQNANR